MTARTSPRLSPHTTYLGAGIVAALLAAGYLVHDMHAQAADDDAPTTVPAVAAEPDVLHYPPGAPQLSYLHIRAVAATTPPALPALPARIGLDENHTVRVYPPVAGTVSQILVQPGQSVRAGQVLAWLASPDFDAALSDLHKAQAIRDSTAAALLRAQRLHDAGVIATKDLDQASADARVADAELARTLAHARELGGTSPATGGRYALRAPIDGTVAERHLNPGQQWRPDAGDPAFVITDLHHLNVEADVAESDVNKLHVGQAVHVEGPGLGQPLTGQITFIGVLMDPTTRRIPVRAVLDRPDNTARPEMFVQMTALDEGRAPLTAVPNSAIVTIGQQSFVFVERQPGELRKTPVVLAEQGPQDSYIRSGVQAGMRLATQGAVLLNAELASSN